MNVPYVPQAPGMAAPGMMVPGPPVTATYAQVQTPASVVSSRDSPAMFQTGTAQRNNTSVLQSQLSDQVNQFGMMSEVAAANVAASQTANAFMRQVSANSLKNANQFIQTMGSV